MLENLGIASCTATFHRQGQGMLLGTTLLLRGHLNLDPAEAAETTSMRRNVDLLSDITSRLKIYPIKFHVWYIYLHLVIFHGTWR